MARKQGENSKVHSKPRLKHGPVIAPLGSTRTPGNVPISERQTYAGLLP